MEKTLIILGRQPSIGLAELEAVFSKKAVSPIKPNGALLSIKPHLFRIDRLGGSVKSCKLISTIQSTDRNTIESAILEILTERLKDSSNSKLNLGFSFYGLNISTKSAQAIGMNIKNKFKNMGFSLRVVPNQSSDLNCAQVIHNKLTNKNGIELVFIRNKKQTIIGQTIEVQDIKNYTFRDRFRPKRDTRVGMLPPKLAQIIINLALGDIKSGTILDPFCGTGVVPQESLLMGFDAYGTDIEKRMIEFSEENLKWLSKKYQINNHWKLEVGDAKTYTWQRGYASIASETYLGKPLYKVPNKSELKELVEQSNTLHIATLKNLSQQLPSGFRMCLAVPAWINSEKITRLPVLDDLESLGYTRLSFTHARNRDLIYFRKDQLVGRELVVLRKN